MSKNAFTPDGGPHRPDRVRNVSDGLTRLGEFEAAEMLTNYAALLRERESAKAAVTDEMVMRAIREVYGEAYEYLTGESLAEEMRVTRRALEAVAPMLASARVPDAMEVDGSPFQTWDHDTYKEYGYALGWNACRAAALAAAPKPETEE